MRSASAYSDEYRSEQNRIESEYSTIWPSTDVKPSVLFMMVSMVVAMNEQSLLKSIIEMICSAFLPFRRSTKASKSLDGKSDERGAWLEFNDTNVREFKYSNLESECFGGENSNR